MDGKHNQAVIDQYKTNPVLESYYRSHEVLSPEGIKRFEYLDHSTIDNISQLISKQKEIAKQIGATQAVQTEDLYGFHVTRFFPKGIIRPRQYALDWRDKYAEAQEQARVTALQKVSARVSEILNIYPQTIDIDVAKLLNLNVLDDGIDKASASLIATIFGSKALKSELRNMIEDECGVVQMGFDHIHLATSVGRSTVHFTINHLVTPHEGHPGWADDSFVVIAKLNDIQGHFVGGYIEDIYSVGPVRLNGDITIFVNKELYKNDKELQFAIEARPANIKIQYYSGKYQDAVVSWCKGNGIQLLQTQDYISSTRKDDVMFVSHSDKKYLFDSVKITQSLKLKFAEHAATPMRTLDKFLRSNPIITITPFLEILHDLKKVPGAKIHQEIRMLIELTKKLYPVPAANYNAFNMQCTAIYKATDIFMNSETQVALNAAVDANKAFLKYFDHFPDFSREVQDHSLTLCVNQFTGLNKFKCFYQNDSSFLVDLVFQDSNLNKKQLESLGEKLSSVFNVQFFVQERYVWSYLITKHVNLEENFKKIHQSLNQDKAQDIQKELSEYSRFDTVKVNWSI